MKRLNVAKATAPLAEYAEDLREPLILMRGKKAVAALVAIDAEDWESISLASSPDFIALIERSRARQAKEGGFSTGQMRRHLKLARPPRS